jgi:malonate decarboxylase delta subunit
MQTLNYEFPADRSAGRAVHVGVVGSGDLEILLEPHQAGEAESRATVRVRTSVNGFDTIWHDVVSRFFARGALAGRWELNDFGATPGVVNLRLRQAFEAAATGGNEETS